MPIEKQDTFKAVLPVDDRDANTLKAVLLNADREARHSLGCATRYQ